LSLHLCAERAHSPAGGGVNASPLVRRNALLGSASRGGGRRRAHFFSVHSLLLLYQAMDDSGFLLFALSPTRSEAQRLVTSLSNDPLNRGHRPSRRRGSVTIGSNGLLGPLLGRLPSNDLAPRCREKHHGISRLSTERGGHGCRDIGPDQPKSNRLFHEPRFFAEARVALAGV